MSNGTLLVTLDHRLNRSIFTCNPPDTEIERRDGLQVSRSVGQLHGEGLLEENEAIQSHWRRTDAPVCGSGAGEGGREEWQTEDAHVVEQPDSARLGRRQEPEAKARNAQGPEQEGAGLFGRIAGLLYARKRADIRQAVQCDLHRSGLVR